jgi:hypothetical protein
MDELLSIFNKLLSTGIGPFAAFLLILGYLNYRGVWVWGRDLKRAEEDALLWKQVALRATGLAGTVASIAAEQRPR